MVQLLEFRHGDVRTTIRHEANHAFWVTASKAEALDKEPIPCNQGLFWTRFEVKGSTTAALVGGVVHVVVHEGGGVDQFERQRKGHHVVSVDPPRGLVGEHEEHRTKALTATHEHVSRHGDDLATARRCCVVKKRFEAAVDLVLERRKSLDLD